MFDKYYEQDEDVRQISRDVRRLLRHKKIDKKNIYLFGVNIQTRKIIRVLREYGLEPKGILDNDLAKQGSYCSRIRVIAVGQVDDLNNDRNFYIIHSAYWREMIAQLKCNNVKKSNIYSFYKHKKPLLKQLFEAQIGRHIYNKLIKKYGEIPIFLCPYTGTGDIYLIGTFWRQYIEKEGITDYIFVVVNAACRKVAMMFDIKNIEILKKRYYVSHLLNYYLLYPEGANIVVLNDSWPHIHTNQIEWFRGYKGLEFADMFRRYVFDLPEKAKPEHPVFKNADKEIFSLFESYHLIIGKTVILSPYSNTLADLPDDFWVSVADRFKESGYIVCTNSNGKNEPAVAGTIPVFFPLNIAPQFVEKAGGFIGIRSGFCDVISAARAKKIILYDKTERFYNGSTFEYFSLAHMGLCNDAIEIQFAKGDNVLVDEILKNFS